MGEEIPLAGGRTQQVVRVGDTVRRLPGANAVFVRGLLGELAGAGYDAVPRWLGVDGRGREIFSFIEGEVPLDLGPFDDAALCHAARLIRAYHDATAPLFGGLVACHNDLSPCNFAFRHGIPKGILDFDLAAQGERLFDLAYAAWTWLDIGNEEDYSHCEQLRRLTLFVEAYDIGGPPTLTDVIDTMMLRQTLLIDQHFGAASDETRAWARRCRTTTMRLRTDALSRY